GREARLRANHLSATANALGVLIEDSNLLIGQCAGWRHAEAGLRIRDCAPGFRARQTVRCAGIKAQRIEADLDKTELLARFSCPWSGRWVGSAARSRTLRAIPLVHLIQDHRTAKSEDALYEPLLRHGWDGSQGQRHEAN